MKDRFIQSHNGSVLIVVVLMLMLLSYWVLGFTKETLFYQRNSSESIDRKKAYQAAKAGLEYSLFLLESQNVESLDGSHQLEEAGFTFQVRNEDGKLDLNSLVDGDGNLVESRQRALMRFLSLAGLEAQAKKIVHSLADWIDADSDPREQGAESASQVQCANSPFQSFAEWSFVQGVQEPMIAPILRKVGTIYSTGKININSAPLEVVATLADQMTENTAREIIAARQIKRFQRVSDLIKVPGMSKLLYTDIEDQLVITGTYYSIVVYGQSKNSEVKIGAVAKREDNHFKIVWFKKDLEENDNFTWN